MAKINFTKFKVPVSFNGSVKYTGSVVGDIGFDKLAETIYFSDGPVEIPAEYIRPMMQVINDGPFMATIKRELIKRLNGNGE